MATFSFNQLLLEMGLDLADIGLLAGLLYAVGALAGSLAAGALVPVLGRRLAILAFAALQSVAILAYLLPAGGSSGLVTLAGALTLVAFAGGASTAALYTAMMDASRAETAGNRFHGPAIPMRGGPRSSARASQVLALRRGDSVVTSCSVPPWRARRSSSPWSRPFLPLTAR